MTGKPDDASPAEVLRAKRLEIVGDEGKVRAALGTDEKGVASLSLFDPSGRLRASLDAEEISREASGLGVFDTNGKLRASVGMSNDPDGESFLTLLDKEGKARVGVGLQTDGQAWLSILAGKKNRSVKLAAMDDGRITLMLSGEGAPMVALGLREEQGQDASSNIVLADKDDRAGIVITARRSGPYMKLSDRREKVRASFQLGANGQPGLYLFDEEGAPVREPNAFERVVAERGPTYQAVLFGAMAVVSVLGGLWIAGTASAAPGSLPAALITAVVLALLVSWLIVIRRRR